MDKTNLGSKETLTRNKLKNKKQTCTCFIYILLYVEYMLFKGLQDKTRGKKIDINRITHAKNQKYDYPLHLSNINVFACVPLYVIIGSK